MASLFGRNRLRELAQKINTGDINSELAILKTWHNDYHDGSLKRDKETSREQAYNQDIFIKILGFKEKPAIPFTFEPKATTEKGQLPDAVIGYTDVSKDTVNISAVVELKGASVDLDRPQRREGNFSPVQQGFKYKTQYRNCPFVIVSNFWELRLYHDNLLDYEVWTLDDLVDPTDDYLKFKTFFILLHTKNLTSEKGSSKTEILLSDIRVEQEEIGRKFYKHYRQARLDLLRDVYKHNEYMRRNIEVGIEKAQKIIDRMVFTVFAEDSGLLPDNTLHRVVQAADSSAFGGSLWSTFKAFFEAIDKGSTKLDIPNGYNGGLFRHDPRLDSLVINDEPLRQVAQLAKYNFSEDLTVNILGHIFEQSISDLEEIKSKVNKAQNLEEISQSRRKKEGIFYTPDYIVRYIVDNSLGKRLREAEEKFKNEFGLKGDITDKTYEKREKQAYSKYQDYLQNIKVVDPACGSGAFLVYVFDFLLAENKRVASILGHSLFSSEEYIRSILQNNIYGVDLNEESVEITKLSLWLKTAEKGKKLTSLDKNIKCGNSLIDDPEVAGHKAFNWENEFADVMKNGGFDVVIGNPPYVSAMDIKKYSTASEYNFLKKNYKTAVGTVDLYIYFFEKGLSLLKDGGKLSYISPNRYLSASYGKALREWLINNFKIASLVDYSDKKVFADASTYPVISFIDKEKVNHYKLYTGKIDETSKQAVLREFDSSKLTILDEYILGFLLNDKLEITEKVFKQGESLSSVGTINATSTAKEADEFSPLVNEEGRGLKLINTGTIDPYASLWGTSTLTNKGGRYLEPYLDIYNEIVSSNRRNLYESPKIIISKIGLRCEAFYDISGEYTSINTNCIHSFSENYSPEYVQCWLNSKLYNYTFECLFDGLRMSGGYLLYSSPNLKNTSIKKLSRESQRPFINAAQKLAGMHKDLLNKDSHFRKLVTSEFGLSQWPTRLNQWWRSDFAKFTKPIKQELSLQQKDELLKLFNKYGAACLSIDKQISEVETQIDKLFYDLYGLTNAEISEVEAAFSNAPA